MKTLEALYQEVLASDELKKALAEAAKTPDGLTQWVRAQDCDATAEEIEAFLKEKQEKASELSDDELATAAGGCNTYEAIDSMISLGFGCIGRRRLWRGRPGRSDPLPRHAPMIRLFIL